MLVMVDPPYQRQGIGRRLLHRGLVTLERRGVTRVQVGGGGHTYFWPGVPVNLSQAWAFFRACGWAEVERSFDLILDLDEYVTPAGIYERVRLPGVTFTAATWSDMPSVLAFEARYFPAWHHYYCQLADRGGWADGVPARHPTDGVVGVTSAWYPAPPWPNEGQGWQEMLGENTGGDRSAWHGRGLSRERDRTGACRAGDRSAARQGCTDELCGLDLAARLVWEVGVPGLARVLDELEGAACARGGRLTDALAAVALAAGPQSSPGSQEGQPGAPADSTRGRINQSKEKASMTDEQLEALRQQAIRLMGEGYV